MNSNIHFYSLISYLTGINSTDYVPDIIVGALQVLIH